MNRLPYVNDTFDVILFSATTHHSADVDATIGEVARVLKKGGIALILNDPIKGLIKSLGGASEHARDHLIHENEYPISRYRKAFRENSFRCEYLFSAYYDKKLREGDIHRELRFAAVGRVTAKAWKWSWLRGLALKKLVWPAHLVFGLPLNVIAYKPNIQSEKS